MEPAETRRHFFDLKIPLGILLEFYGVLLALYGLLGPGEIYRKSLGININLIWGILMMVVGGLFILVAYSTRNEKA